MEGSRHIEGYRLFCTALLQNLDRPAHSVGIPGYHNLIRTVYVRCGTDLSLSRLLASVLNRFERRPEYRCHGTDPDGDSLLHEGASKSDCLDRIAKRNSTGGNHC